MKLKGIFFLEVSLEKKKIRILMLNFQVFLLKIKIESSPKKLEKFKYFL